LHIDKIAQRHRQRFRFCSHPHKRQTSNTLAAFGGIPKFEILNSNGEVPCCADAVSSAKPDSSEGSDVDKIKAKFVDFPSSASSPHGLDAYTKQAIAIALSVATRCEPCLKMHLKKAKEKGFTQAEIDEAAWMGISFAGSPAMVFYEQNKNY
jgi:AhpD family alkylhydroperoxidase